MQLAAIAIGAALLVGGGIVAWAPWDDGFDWEGLSCKGTPTPFEGPLDGRIRFHIENRALAAPGKVCVFDQDRVLRATQDVYLRANDVTIIEIPVAREPLASRAAFGIPGGGSSSSGSYQDVADCQGGVAIHATYFRFTETGAGGGSLDEPSTNCDLPWTSWFDEGQEDAAKDEPQTLAMGPSAPSNDGPDQGGWYVGFAVAGAAGGIVWFVRTKVAWMLFTRLRRSTLLDQKVRAQIHELVTVEPGIHASGIAQTLELAQGQVHYHLSVLVRDGLLRRLGTVGRRRYFVAGSLAPQDMERVALLRSTPVASLFEVIQGNPGASVSTLAQKIGWSVPRVSRFLAQMERSGLIERRPRGRFVQVFPRSLPQGLSAPATPA